MVSAEDGNESARREEDAAADRVIEQRDRLGTGTVPDDVVLRDLDRDDGRLAVPSEAAYFLRELADFETVDAALELLATSAEDVVDLGDGDEVVLDDDELVSPGFVAEQDRRDYELRLLDRARAAGFKRGCPPWEGLATTVAQYAMGVLKGWISSGRLWAESKKIWWSVNPTVTQAAVLAGDEQARDVLVNEITASALRRWRTLERNGLGWQQDGRASLRTWFMSLCVRETPNGYRRWARTQRWRDGEDLEAVDGAFGFDVRVESPLFPLTERTVLGIDELTQVLEKLECSEIERRAIELQALGYSYAQIAVLLKLPGRDEVHNVLRRVRYRASRLREDPH